MDERLQNIRNIGIIAHIDAGKTTLSERILFYTRKIHRMGEVHDGAATMDYLPEEQERGITIISAMTSCEWRGKTLNLIDTPGHVDFTIEVERSLRVLDGAVGVFCAVGGVEPQSETVWRQSERFGVPKVAFINKMDRQGADFEAVLRAMRLRLGANPVPLALPSGQGEDFDGILDVLLGKKLLFDPEDQGRTMHIQDLSPEETAAVGQWHEFLLEKLAENDEIFLPLYLDAAFSQKDIRAALRRTTLSRAITPVLCGSALRNTGIQPLLDAICGFLPSPLDMPAPEVHSPDGAAAGVSRSPAAPPLGLVFKILVENGRKLALLRMYAGCLKEGDIIRNVSQKSSDRVGHIYRLHADRRERTPQVTAGEMAAVTGLRSARTGDTYSSAGRDILLEAIESRPPVITLLLEPRNADEGKVLDDALQRYVEEDPTLLARLDEETGARMVSGMGELHLDILLERLRREFGINPRAGHPQVVLRETVAGEASGAAVFDRELGKERHHGAVSLRVKPRRRNAGNLVAVGGFLPEDPALAQKILPGHLLRAALEGVRDVLQSGPDGWPLQDIDVLLTGVEKVEGRTTAPGCHTAAGLALREAVGKASPVMLEPIMRVEINVPDDFLGAAINALNTCNGRVENLEDRNGQKLLHGSAPLRKLFGFSTALRSATQGRAGLSLAFDRFDKP
ncbi:MAG: elongation factor G [Desulfovibrio sp.]|jgi:elongation factor G|nr:elongation factor G [Desulfovibrio sp.]